MEPQPRGNAKSLVHTASNIIFSILTVALQPRGPIRRTYTLSAIGWHQFLLIVSRFRFSELTFFNQSLAHSTFTNKQGSKQDEEQHGLHFMASETFHSSLNAGTNSIGSGNTRKHARQEALPQSPESSQSPQGIRQPTQKQGFPQSSPTILQIQIPSFTKTLAGSPQITPGGR